MKVSQFSVVQMVASIGQSVGGPPRSVTQLSKGLLDEGVAVSLLTASWQDDPNVELDARLRLIEVEGCKLFGRRYTCGFGGKLAQSGVSADVYHMHGLWLNCCREFAGYARQVNSPLVVAPRGMLEPWAMRHKAWKKKLVWNAFQKSDLKKANGFHATAESEADSIRNLGFRQPIAVIPNGVHLPMVNAINTEKESNQKTVLFLSRINPKKGLLMLLGAWKELAPQGWRLVIAGNDDSNHLPVVSGKIAELGLGNEVEFVGPLFNAAKDVAFRKADLFVLPSYSENFGIVVAEALGYGVPVITTTGCPWEELETSSCGWWVEPTQDAIQCALQEAFALGPNQLIEMGLRGRELIGKRYQWGGIAERALEFYDWVVNGGRQPDFVI